MRASRVLALLGVGTFTAFGCRSPQSASAPVAEVPLPCPERQTTLLQFIQSLPDQSVVSTARADLPESDLGEAPGTGPILEVWSEGAAIDGAPLAGSDLLERTRAFGAWLSTWVRPEGARAVLYVAGAKDLEVETLRRFLVLVPEPVAIRLLVRTKVADKTQALAGSDDARAVAAELLGQSEPKNRRELVVNGYAAATSCPTLTQATTSMTDSDLRTWSSMKTVLLNALPTCACDKLDATSLRLIVSAEQRRGAGSLGWVPLSFVRDERCGASMPERSLMKLVRQIEGFDEEFAGDLQENGIKFGDVLANDRLRVVFCDALPGETLAAKARAHDVVYFRTPGEHSCDAWSFAPLAPGTPMGTWSRVPKGAETPLSFHYWQATEEIRIFGPVDPASPSKPTDTRASSCEETYKLTGIDENSIALDKGRWFFTDDACERASDDAATFTGCVGNRIGQGGASPLVGAPSMTSNPHTASK